MKWSLSGVRMTTIVNHKLWSKFLWTYVVIQILVNICPAAACCSPKEQALRCHTSLLIHSSSQFTVHSSQFTVYCQCWIDWSAWPHAPQKPCDTGPEVLLVKPWSQAFYFWSRNWAQAVAISNARKNWNWEEAATHSIWHMCSVTVTVTVYRFGFDFTHTGTDAEALTPGHRPTTASNRLHMEAHTALKNFPSASDSQGSA